MRETHVFVSASVNLHPLFLLSLAESKLVWFCNGKAVSFVCNTVYLNFVFLVSFNKALIEFSPFPSFCLSQSCFIINAGYGWSAISRVSPAAQHTHACLQTADKKATVPRRRSSGTGGTEPQILSALLQKG